MPPAAQAVPCFHCTTCANIGVSRPRMEAPECRHIDAPGGMAVTACVGTGSGFPAGSDPPEGCTFPRRNRSRRETLFPRGSRDFPILCNGLPGIPKTDGTRRNTIAHYRSDFLAGNIPGSPDFLQRRGNPAKNLCREVGRPEPERVSRAIPDKAHQERGLYGSGGNMYSVTYGR